MTSTTLRSALAAILGASLTVACAGDGPTRPAGVRPAEGAKAVANDVRAVRGRAHLIVRRFDQRSRFGRIVQQEDGDYVAEVRGNHSSGKATFPSGTFDAAALDADRPGRGPGMWDRSVAGAVAHITRSENGNTAYDEIELRRAGVVKGRIAKTWARDGNAWRLEEFTSTIYGHDAPVASVTVTFDEGESALSSAATVAAGPRSAFSVAPVDVVAHYASACGAEEYAAKNALIALDAANAGLVGCVAGPWACIAAVIDATTAAFKYDNAIATWEACLAEY